VLQLTDESVDNIVERETVKDIDTLLLVDNVTRDDARLDKVDTGTKIVLGVDVRHITVLKDSVTEVIIIGPVAVGTLRLLPIGEKKELVMAVYTDDVSAAGITVVSDLPVM
jgi:hypothetical protein